MLLAIVSVPRGTFIKVHYPFTICTQHSNDNVPSYTCFIVHASCTEELDRFVHHILSFTICTHDVPTMYHRLPTSVELAPIKTVTGLNCVLATSSSGAQEAVKNNAN